MKRSAEVENYIHAEFQKIRVGKLKPLAPRRVRKSLQERATPFIETAMRIVPPPKIHSLWHEAMEVTPLPGNFQRAAEILIRVAMKQIPDTKLPVVETTEDERVGRFVMYAREEQQPVVEQPRREFHVPRLELTPSSGGFGNVLVVASCLLGMLVSIAWAFSQ
jgi:hypothetical protein